MLIGHKKGEKQTLRETLTHSLRRNSQHDKCSPNRCICRIRSNQWVGEENIFKKGKKKKKRKVNADPLIFSYKNSFSWSSLTYHIDLYSYRSQEFLPRRVCQDRNLRKKLIINEKTKTFQAQKIRGIQRLVQELRRRREWKDRVLPPLGFFFLLLFSWI